MDLRLLSGHTMVISGPSGSGKTLLTIQILKNRKECFNTPLQHIYWIHGENEEGDTKVALNNLDDVTLIKGFPEGWINLPSAHDVIVVDDLFVESGKEKDLTNLFTRTARHRNIFVIFLTQNLFYQGMRTKSINAHYLILFKNPRDSLAIKTLSIQMNAPDLIYMYRDATTNKPHGYLFIDFTQECPDDVRIRSNLFDDNMIIYRQIL